MVKRGMAGFEQYLANATNCWVDISNDFQVFGVGIGGGDVIIWSRE